jgi:hypothetical protein
VVVVIILPRIVFVEAVIISTLVAVDIIGLYLLVKETWNRKMAIEHGLLVEHP